jgi:L-fuconolactonase
MRLIDPHVHVWKNDSQFPWAPETTNPPIDDATPEMLLKLMAANGVERTVLVQSIHYRWDNRYTAHAMKTFPDKFMGVCRVNPEDPDAPDHLSYWTEEFGFHGVRLSPGAGAAGDWYRGELTERIFDRAEELGVPMLLVTKKHGSENAAPDRLPELAKTLERHSDLNMIVDHMADCAIDRPDHLQHLLNLAEFPRVRVKISHTWWLSKTSYPWVDTHDMVKKVYHTFGGQRIMWATDWPVCLNAATYPQTLSVVRDEMNFFTPEDLEWILGKTALQIWKFPELE